jgi:fatty acid desaturase
MLAKQYADALSYRLPRDLFQPAPSRAWWLLIHGLIAAVCTFAIVNAHLGVLARLLLAVIIGVSYCCMGMLGHEILHGAVVEPLWLRRGLGTVCLAPLVIGPLFWTIWHNIHHAYTQDPAKDPDTWGSSESAPLDPVMGLLRRFIHARSPLFPFLLATGLTAHASVLLFCLGKRLTLRQRAETLAEGVLLWLFWLGLGFWLGWVNFLFFFVIPLLLANTVVNSFVVTNHFLNPLDDTGDPLVSGLTVTAHPLLERLFLNFNYHVEHHLFPRMSPKHAPLVARLLKETWPDRYHCLPFARALLSVWRTPRVYRGRTQLVDANGTVVYGTLGYGLDAHNIAEQGGTPRAS